MALTPKVIPSPSCSRARLFGKSSFALCCLPARPPAFYCALTSRPLQNGWDNSRYAKIWKYNIDPSRATATCLKQRYGKTAFLFGKKNSEIPRMTIDHRMMAWIKKVDEESFNAFYISSDSKESDLISTLNCESRRAAEFWLRSQAESLELPIEWISGPS